MVSKWQIDCRLITQDFTKMGTENYEINVSNNNQTLQVYRTYPVWLEDEEPAVHYLCASIEADGYLYTLEEGYYSAAIYPLVHEKPKLIFTENEKIIFRINH